MSQPPENSSRKRKSRRREPAEQDRKFFTPALANASLPLVRAIVHDIVELAPALRERYERLQRIQPDEIGSPDRDHLEEVEQIEAEFEQEQEKLRSLVIELNQLGVLLKDFDTGLIDFPCMQDGREVYLCWRLGEPEVAHWHEIDSGFSGRRKLQPDAAPANPRS